MLRTAMLATLSLLLGLTLGLGATGTPASGATSPQADATTTSFKPWGMTRAPDQVLRRGCRYYKYRYAINPPSDDWTAEVFLIEPGGDALASAVYSPASDPAAGASHWRICRATTTVGRFRMRMKIVWYDGYDGHAGWVRPGYFRLVRPRR